MKRLFNSLAARVALTLGAVVRRLGYAVIPHGHILIPDTELWRMEREADHYAKYSHRDNLSDRDAGYFNGLSDYAGKTANQLRERYAHTTTTHHVWANGEPCDEH